MLPILKIKNNPARPNFSRAANERGSALILAIAMLAILSLLGAVVLMSSNTEMKITSNYQAAKQTFWVADRAVEYATGRDILMNMGTAVNLMTDAGGVHKSRIEDPDSDGEIDGGVLTAGNILDLGPGDLPAKLSGAYGSDFGANFYQVSVTTQQSTDANAAAVHIDTEIVRIYKNDDDSILLTTEKG